MWQRQSGWIVDRTGVSAVQCQHRCRNLSVLTPSSSTGIGTGIFLLKYAFSSLARMRQKIATMLTTRVPMFVFGMR